MTLSMIGRVTLVSIIWSAVLAPVGYVLIQLMLYKTFDLSPVFVWALVGGAFGLWTSVWIELLPALFAGRHPWLGMAWFTAIGAGAYAAISLLLGAPLFAPTWKEGLLQAAFYSAFMSATIFMVSAVKSESPAQMFSAMCAGFIFQPVLAALKLAPAADLQQCLYGCVCAFLLSAVYDHTARAAYKSAFER
ncbi:MAG: hypothetical protein IPG59_12595 [Candidatus Melainabacteria bacterium]|nr:MAG: hypothetical protein IPG59_12595 [Candidatus Melainabacteria bacterium]